MLRAELGELRTCGGQVALEDRGEYDFRTGNGQIDFRRRVNEVGRLAGQQHFPVPFRECKVAALEREFGKQAVRFLGRTANRVTVE